MGKKENLRKELYQVRVALAQKVEEFKRKELEQEARELHSKLSKAILEEKLKGRGK